MLVVSAAAAPAAFAEQRTAPQQAPSHTVSTMTGGVSIETQDSLLAAALVRVLSARIPENLEAVADRYYRLGVRDKAMDYYLESLRRSANRAPALDGIARIWRDWGEMGRALGTAHRATYFAPRSAEAWNTLGTILQALDQNALAGDAYRRAISVDSNAVYARSNLCYLAFAEGDTDLAITECTAALAVDRRFAPATNNLALAYAAAGDRQRASLMFTTAAGAAAGHYNTGLVLLAERDYSAAVLAFEAAYRVEPSFDAAHARAREARLLARRARGTIHADR